MNLAPIALFAYNRPDHTRRTIEALQKNDLASASDLIIFSDGYKNELGKDKVNAVRKYLRTVSGFKSVQIVGRSENLGLAKSIISGVTEVVDKYGKIIVLEDDLLTSPYFLKYMNEALDLYEHEDRVISIHGYNYPVKGILPETFFLRGADCWGWATWKRGWNIFENDGNKLLLNLIKTKQTKVFDMGGYPYIKMLRDQIVGRNNSWAIRWRASAFLKGMFTLYPGRSLVENIGFDKSGTHGGKNSILKTKLSDKEIILNKILVKEDPLVVVKIRRYFFMVGLLVRLKSVLKFFNIVK